MKRTSNGMERKSTPTFNGPIAFQPHAMDRREVAPKPPPPADSWWTVTDRAEFRKRLAVEQERMSRTAISVPHKDAIDR